MSKVLEKKYTGILVHRKEIRFCQKSIKIGKLRTVLFF